MTVLILIPLIILALAIAAQPVKPRRYGYIERVPKGHGAMPLPPMPAENRARRWRALYDQVPIEQQIEPGGWPFPAPIKTAVHALPSELQTDPRELIR